MARGSKHHKDTTDGFDFDEVKERAFNVALEVSEMVSHTALRAALNVMERAFTEYLVEYKRSVEKEVESRGRRKT